MKKKWSRIVQLALFFLALLIIFSGYISPAHLGIIGFLPPIIPFLLVALFFFLAFSLWYRKWRLFAVSLLLLLISYSHIKRTFQLPKKVKPMNSESFSVMSYNARVFNVYKEFRGEGRKNRYKVSKNMIEWLVKSEVDILCFQEFYNHKPSSTFNTTAQLSKNWQYPHVIPKFVNWAGGEFGLAIFSTFPMLAKGEISFDTPTTNGAIYADLLIGKDTVRVINIHLESLHLNQSKLVSDSIYAYRSDIINALDRSTEIRANQVDDIIEFLRKTPHPYLICGDFNETPYGYAYQSFLSLAKNSFEEVGKGFGFTFNSFPYILRIDNQFSSEELEVLDFNTLSKRMYSDHFPIQGTYQLKKKSD